MTVGSTTWNSTYSNHTDMLKRIYLMIQAVRAEITATQTAGTTSKLRGSSTSSTTIQDITLGTNLSMSGSTLNATGGGVTVNQTMAYTAAY